MDLSLSKNVAIEIASGLRLTYRYFVCLTTKPVHLELASDLTTEAFLACLKRFFARRGHSDSISSDNATNFVGADRELRELYQRVNSIENNKEIQTFLGKKGINWHFIPPRAPHFGGALGGRGQII